MPRRLKDTHSGEQTSRDPKAMQARKGPTSQEGLLVGAWPRCGVQPGAATRGLTALEGPVCAQAGRNLGEVLEAKTTGILHLVRPRNRTSLLGELSDVRELPVARHTRQARGTALERPEGVNSRESRETGTDG